MKKIDIGALMAKFKSLNPSARLKGLKFNRQFFIILLIVVVGIIIISRTTSNIQKVIFKKKPEVAKKAPSVSFEEEAAPVKVFKIKKTDFKDTLPAIGSVKGFKEVDLKFQVAGIIESFNFEEGEKIQEGDIIASLIQRDALLRLKYAEVELKKNTKLFEIGAISQMKMDQAKLEYESAKSDLEKTNIYAMSNGLLGAKILDVGSYVSPSTNDRVGVFVNIDKVFAEFSIIEKDVPKVALGQKAEVFADAYPNKSFSGVVDRMSPLIEGRSRTENIKVELDNKEGALKPGMFVRALISTYEKKDAIVIPTSALKKKEKDYFVYVIHKEEPKKVAPEAKPKDKSKMKFNLFGAKKEKETVKPEIKEKEAEFGMVEVRGIKLGYMTQDLVEVGEGLKEDELIITEVQEEFKDKAKIEITEVQEGLI